MVLGMEIHTQAKKAVDLRCNPPALLNVPEASQYIGISQRFLRTIIKERKVPSVRIGSRVFLRLVDIDRWIESKLEGAAS